NFFLQRGAVVVGVGGIARLYRQFTDTLQVVADLAQRAFGGLRQRDAVVGVAGSLVQAADLRGHALGDRQAGGVVLGAVDAQTGGQALDRGIQRRLRSTQVALGIQRRDVGIDDCSHVFLLVSGVGSFRHKRLALWFSPRMEGDTN